MGGGAGGDGGEGGRGARFDLVTSIPITWIDWAVIQVRHAMAARQVDHATAASRQAMPWPRDGRTTHAMPWLTGRAERPGDASDGPRAGAPGERYAGICRCAGPGPRGLTRPRLAVPPLEPAHK